MVLDRHSWSILIVSDFQLSAHLVTGVKIAQRCFWRKMLWGRKMRIAFALPRHIAWRTPSVMTFMHQGLLVYFFLAVPAEAPADFLLREKKSSWITALVDRKPHTFSLSHRQMPKDAEHDMQVTHICTCVVKKLAELAYLQDATCCAVRGLALILAEFESQDVEPQYSVEDIRTEGAVVYFFARSLLYAPINFIGGWSVCFFYICRRVDKSEWVRLRMRISLCLLGALLACDVRLGYWRWLE